MIVIRFARRGRKNHAFYDIVLAEKARAVKKKFIKKLGFYDPHADKGQGKLVFDAEKVSFYIKNGAQISDSLAKRLVKAGFEAAKPFVAFRASKPKKEAPAKETENKEEASA